MKKDKIEETCEQIISMLVAYGFRYQVTDRDLEQAIIDVRGMDPRTARRWIDILFKKGYLKGLPLHRYEINFARMPTKLVELLREKPQTRIE